MGSYEDVKADLINVKQIFSTAGAFAALKEDGELVTWGSSSFGALRPDVRPTNVVDVYSTSYTFITKHENGDLKSWNGGNSSSTNYSFDTNVVDVYTNLNRWAVLEEDGSVTYNGQLTNEQESQLNDINNPVVDIFPNERAFAALRADGTVITWGQSTTGGDSTDVSHLLTDVVSITAAKNAFAALKSDGSIVTWGVSAYGGDSSTISDSRDPSNTTLTNDIEHIYGNPTGFVGLRADGTVVGGVAKRSGAMASYGSSRALSGITEIVSNDLGYVAIKADGGIAAWNQVPSVAQIT